jgi:hypothetical protein
MKIPKELLIRMAKHYNEDADLIEVWHKQISTIFDATRQSGKEPDYEDLNVPGRRV